MKNVDLITEEKIYYAAEEEFLEKGFTGARLQKIADKAGLNKALLHYYFRNKEKLFDTVFEKIAGQIISPLLDKITSNATIFEKIRYFFDYHISAIENNQRLPLFIINELSKNPQKVFQIVNTKEASTVKTKLENQLNEEIKNGIIKPIKLEELVINCISLSVFNFVIKPIYSELMNSSDKDFEQFLTYRKKSLAEFVINSIKV